jgi:hypothetical protein
MDDFRLAALSYFAQGYTTIPLARDAQGLPKRPFTDRWQMTPHKLDVIQGLPWEQAVGIGIILGPVSGNLAVIDIDDVDLAQAVIAKCQHTTLVRTARGRCHVYVKELVASKTREFKVQWRGRLIPVELRATGVQVAAPPTPGYTYLTDVDPKIVGDIGVAWAGLARSLGIAEMKESDYPKPWAARVSASERNKSAYIEAHLLREGKMPINLAMAYMKLRWEQDYEQGDQTWDEVARTIESAYAKAVIPPLYAMDHDASHLL